MDAPLAEALEEAEAKLAALYKKRAKLEKRNLRLARLEGELIYCEFENRKQFDEIFSILIGEEKRKLDEQNKKIAQNIVIYENKIDEIDKQKKIQLKQMLNFLIYSVNCGHLSLELKDNIKTLIGFTSDWYINGPIFLGKIGASVKEIDSQLKLSKVTTSADLLFRKELKDFEHIDHSRIKTIVDKFIVRMKAEFCREMEAE